MSKETCIFQGETIKVKCWHILSGIIKNKQFSKTCYSPQFLLGNKTKQKKPEKPRLQNLLLKWRQICLFVSQSSIDANLGLLTETANLICFQLSGSQYNWCQENKSCKAGTILLQLREIIWIHWTENILKLVKIYRVS